MGGGKSSGSQSTQAQLTPEQIQTINLQNQFLQSYLPTLTGVTQGAGQAYGNQQGAVNQASQNAINTANTAGNLQGNVGANALIGGTQGLQNASNQATGQGQAMVGKGGAGASGLAGTQANQGNALLGQGAGGASGLAGAQGAQGLGLIGGGASNAMQLANAQGAQGLQNANLGSSALSNLFNPQYEQSQIAGVLAPAEQAAQRANVAQEAGFAGAGQLGSARDALAAQQTQNINTQTLGSLAAQTQAGIQQQQAQAAGSLLTGGLQGLNQAGSNYGNLLQTGTSLAGQAGQNYGNLLNAGNTAQGQAGQNYGNLLNAGNTAQGQGISGYGALTGAGTTNVGAAPGTIGSTVGYASAPLSNYGQYASLLFGAPQQTPNYAGTQGQTQSGSSKGGGLSFSDIRLKTIINNLNYGLNEILKINPISWFWKNKEILGDKKEIGFSAQEMQKIIPEIVYTENEILKIDYSKLTAVLTIAVQQQQLQIDQINQKIKEREFA